MGIILWCTSAGLPPGFRFQPTDEELIVHYLCKRAAAMPCPVPIVAELDIHKFDPWDLPAKAVNGGERKWYFFSPCTRKYSRPNDKYSRPNRAAGSGYWKATGRDKAIIYSIGDCKMLATKQALVFYKGRPPRGRMTAWIMHEYRRHLPAEGTKVSPSTSSSSMMVRTRLQSNQPHFIFSQTRQLLELN